MAQYLLSMHSVEGEVQEPMTDEQMQQFMTQVNVLEEEMRSTGTYLFGAPFTAPTPPPSCACPAVMY